MGDDLIYGIDLGTTFSAIAYVNPQNQPMFIHLGDKGELTIPSAVLLMPGGKVYVGQDAIENSWEEDSLLIECAKRDIGLHSTRWPMKYEGWSYYPEDISALVLRKIKQLTNAEHGAQPVREVVISHPQYFFMNQKEATKLAGDFARLKVVATITEPQAAAIAYGIRERIERQRQDITVMVFDLGGGTLDVTLMKIGESVLEMVGSKGNARLGGVDWDAEIEKLVKDRFRIVAGDVDFDNLASTEQAITLRKEAMKAKEELSKKDMHRFMVVGGDQMMQVILKRSEFEMLTQFLVTSCLRTCDELFQETGYNWATVDEILMVGSSTKMPMIQAAVSRASGKTLIMDKDPKLMVSKGAAIWGHWVKHGLTDPRWAQTHEENVSGLEIREAPGVSGRTAHGLGVLARREGKEIISVLIPQNTTTPHTAEQVFYTTQDNATSILIPLYEGETEDPEYSMLMREMRIDGFPPKPKGSPVKVRFSIDLSGRLEVEVVDVQTNLVRKVMIDKTVVRDSVKGSATSFEERLRHLDNLTIM